MGDELKLENWSWDEAAAVMQSELVRTQEAIAQFDRARAVVQQYQDRATAEIARVLRAAGAKNLNLEAIRKTPEKPYRLVRVKENEYLMVQWRGIETPPFGMLEAQDDVFNVFRVTPAMRLMSEFPTWMEEEMDWRPPPYRAVVEGENTRVRVTDGDEGAFKRKFGELLGAKQGDGTFKIREGDAWLKLIASLAHDGIYPWQARPVTSEYWDASAVAIDPNPDAKGAPIVLRDYQQPSQDEWLANGAGTNTLPMGGGKGYIALDTLAKFGGRTYLLTDSSAALNHWEYVIEKSIPNRKKEIVLATYQGAQKFGKEKFDLLLCDEAHRVPAPTFSKLAYMDVRWRLGFSGTPWREQNQELIFALLGPPLRHIPWSKLIAAGVMKRVPVIVDLVGDENVKVAMVKRLLAERRGGRALVYCDWIEKGNSLANALGVPFVHGQTQGNKLDIIMANEVCVVSKIARSTLDLHDLTRVIDFGFQQNSQVQGAQTWGRLGHSKKSNLEYHLLFTKEEYGANPRRLWGILSNLGEQDVEVRDHTTRGAQGLGNRSVRSERGATRIPPARLPAASKTKTVKTKPSNTSKPKREMEEWLAVPSVKKLLDAAEAKIGKDAAGFVTRALALCWDSAVSVEEIAIGKAASKNVIARYAAGYRRALECELVADLTPNERDFKKKRFMANKTKIKGLVDLWNKFH